MNRQHRSYKLAIGLTEALAQLRSACEDTDVSNVSLQIDLPDASVDERLGYIRELERGIIMTIDEHLEGGR